MVARERKYKRKCCFHRDDSQTAMEAVTKRTSIRLKRTIAEQPSEQMTEEFRPMMATTTTTRQHRSSSLLSSAGQNKLKIFLSLLGVVVLALNIVQSLHFDGETNGGRDENNTCSISNTPIEHCPVHAEVRDSLRIMERFYRSAANSVVEATLCFGAKGPTIELRHYGGGERCAQSGLDLTPNQFRQLFQPNSAFMMNVTEHLAYIPVAVV